MNYNGCDVKLHPFLNCTLFNRSEAIEAPQAPGKNKLTLKVIQL